MLVCLPILAQCPQISHARDVGYNQHHLLEEISGIIASRTYLNLFWVHNDSGDEARFYAMDIGGNHRGTFILPDRKNVDYEDIAIGFGPNGRDYLYIGDIGDNRAKRDTIQVLRVLEPAPLEKNKAVAISGSVSFSFRFEDGSRDAEAMFIDPCTGDLYIISKREDRSRVYVAQAPFSTEKVNLLEFKIELPWGWVTAADLSPNHDYIIAKSYRQAAMWPVPQDGPLWKAFESPECPIELHDEPQGEAITFDFAGRCIVHISEYTDEWVFHYDINDP
jgi:hypothetical protein